MIGNNEVLTNESLPHDIDYVIKDLDSLIYS